MKLSFTLVIILTIAILLNNIIQLQLSNAQNFTTLDNKSAIEEIECHSEETF